MVATLLIPIGLISADDKSHLKDGLWSIHTRYAENPSGIKGETNTSYCRDRVHDNREKAATSHGKCKTISDNTTSGNTRVTENECPASNGLVKTKLTFTMINDSLIHTETFVSFDPPVANRRSSTIVTDQRYVGACPAGVVPGDILGAAGKVVHHGNH